MAIEFQTTDLRKGLKIEIDGKAYIIIKSDFTNPGKGSAFVKCKIKNLETGAVIDRTFKSGVATNTFKPDLEEKEVKYMYSDRDGHHFMDQASYETIDMTELQVGDAKGFLQEDMELKVLYYKSKPISIELPNFVKLKVEETDPGLKGNSASNSMKKAIMETGLQVSVPLFVQIGEVIKIDTRTGEYIERVKK